MTKLQYFRKEKNISQFELAKRADMSIQTIQKYEQAIYPIEACRLDGLIRLSKVLDVPFYMLIDNKVLAEDIRSQLNVTIASEH